MAPRQSSAQRRSMAASEAFHDLGVRGRKTGVTLKDTGVRDEHGMQPLDDLFSSPDKESHDGRYDDAEEDESEEEEEPMDIDEVTAPAPSAFMNGRPPARARSPLKTTLNSPARRPAGMSSSPLRPSKLVDGSPSGAKSVQRRLDFKNDLLASKPVLPKPNGMNGVNGKGKAAAAVNGRRSSPSEPEEESERGEEESMAMLDGGGDNSAFASGDGPEEEEEREEEEEEEEDEEEEEVEEDQQQQGEEEAVEAPPSSTKKGRGRSKKIERVQEQEEDRIVESIEPADEEPVRAGKKRGRLPANHAAQEEAEKQPAKKKAKGSNSHVGDEEGEPAEQAPKRRGRPKAAAAERSTAGPAKKPAISKQKRAAKRTSDGVGDTSVAEIPRGPPLPKSRGLVITRREAPGAGANMFTTRSGRTSYQPLKFWRNERTELDDDAILEDGKTSILLPHIKNIVRIDEPEPDQKGGQRRRGRPAGKKGGGKRRGGHHEDEDDVDELEPWEEDGDVITGEIAVWQPEHEVNPPGPDEQIEVADEQIAVSANAITTREIRNATFRFAKTLSLPFFGSGVVDLPPHAEKKPKNSRKMHMTFFVFSGRVTVTVADTVFSIGRGGMWFVPRGNYYSIENVQDRPARIFFSQGCEVTGLAGADVSQMA